MDAVVIATWVALAVAAVAAAFAYFQLTTAKRDSLRNATVEEFMAIRDYQKRHIRELIDFALSFYQKYRADPDLPVLTKPGWVLPEPIALTRVILRRLDTSKPSIDNAAKKLQRYWPVRGIDRRMARYHQAVEMFDKPKNWFDAVAYRILNVVPMDGTVDMTFGVGSYFDMIDTTESLLYEAAMVHDRSKGRRIQGVYRRWLKSPFNFGSRCVILGIDVVTIRLEGETGTFYIHRRDAERVASGRNLIGLVPAGEFEPSDDSHEAQASDFDLGLTIMREYVEEFLGVEDARERQGAPIDFRTEPYSLLHDGFTSGMIKCYVLGIGLDPITCKPGLLAVCIFPAALFDEIFKDMVRDNPEGKQETPKRARTIAGPFKGWDFDSDHVSAYVNDLGVMPVARAALALAWRHRKSLGISAK